MERRGLPAFVICSDKFEALGRAQADTLGAKRLGIGVIKHPLGGISEQELAERCREAHQAVKAWLDALLQQRLGAAGEE